MTENNYQPLVWYQRFFRKIKSGIYHKIRTFRFPWFKAISVLLLGLIILAIYLTVVLTKIKVEPRSPYDKEGFMTAADYRDLYGNETVLENDRYRFTLSNTDTTFAVTDKSNNEEWRSNPAGASLRFRDPLIVYYAGSLGAVHAMGVIENAVDYDDFLIRRKDDSIEILYLIGGKKKVDASDFPKIITDARMQEKILSKLEPGTTPYRRVTEQCYVFGDFKGEKIWQLKDAIQTSLLEVLYDIFYHQCGYTSDDLAYDLELSGIKYEDKYAYIEIALEYSLGDNGFSVRMINDSISEKEKYPLVYADILPYFGCAGLDDEGYILVPDGSGALIEHNNGRSFAVPYNQRLYGKEAAVVKPVMKPETEKVSFPVYGLRRNDKSFITVCKEGAEMTALLANGSTVDRPYNQAYYRYYLRESESFEFSSYQSRVTVIEWTVWYNTADWAAEYRFVNEDNGSYTAMAQAYRSYLVGAHLLPAGNDIGGLRFNLTLLGGYIARENFLGIPYKTVRSLTDTEEALRIAQKLHEDGIENLNVIYRGWSNEGLKPTFAGKLRYNRAVGKRSDFRRLQSALAAMDVNLYPEVYLHTAYTDRHFQKNKEAVRNVLGRVVKNYDYNEATYYADTDTLPYYILKPTTYKKTLTALQREFDKFDSRNIAFRDFGGYLYGSYYKKDTYFRNDSRRYFEEAMSGQNSFRNCIFTDPNLYALRYCDLVLEVPMRATPYQIIGVAVPFYQLVVSGSLSYSGKSFNIDDKYAYEWHKMKAIETAAHISFTWSYHSTIDLADTEYSQYYSTYYLNWYERAVATYYELTELGIYNASLVAHELLKSDGSVVKSTYSNGTAIVFNYGLSYYQFEGGTVDPNSYTVVEREVL